MQRVDWEGLWSCEAHKKQLPSLHGGFAGSRALSQPHLGSLLCCSEIMHSMTAAATPHPHH